MAASDENEKYIDPRMGNTDLTNGQYARYQILLKSLGGLKSLFSPKRFQIIRWLWENQYLNSIEPNAFASIRGDMFETFLVAAEKVMLLRKEKGSSNQIINIASEYIITDKFIWSDYNVWENGFVNYFLGQVLWCFYEAYPKFFPVKTSDKEPLEHAVTCMLTLPNSDIENLTTSIAILVPNVRNRGIDDLFGTWVDGKLVYLSRRILNFRLHDRKESKKLLDAGRENGNTINLRLELARYVDGSSRRELLANALDMAKALYGECHAVTWHCTEQLGDFYLKYADEYTLQYYFSKLNGDKVRSVQDIYEDFLNRADELGRSKSLGDSEREALSALLREKVVPTVVNIYKRNGKESEARRLLWKTVKDSSSQIYHANWVPFGRGSGKMRRLMTEIHSLENLEEFTGYSDLKYSSLELVVFSFDEISLKSVTPSDEEKARKWHFVFERLPNGDIHAREITDWSPGLEGGYEPKTIQKTDEAENKEKMILELPYIPYAHFKTSKAYREGSTYDFYRKGSFNQQILDWMKKNEGHYILSFGHDDYSDYIAYADLWPSVGGALVDSEKGQVERFLSDRETGSVKMTNETTAAPKELENPPSYKTLDIGQCKTQIPGFFNSTPGDKAAIDDTGTVTQGFNLVSAEWYDWKRFILHPCSSSTEKQPELVSTDGSPIPVLGYIYGTWTDDKLHKQWRGLQIWIVQATFKLTPDSSQDERSCHFVLNANDICKSREHELSLSETRAICTFLNPSLLRVMNHSMFTPFMCTMGEGIPDDFAGVTKKIDPSMQRDLIAELSFRDAWDTEFAYKWWNRTWGDARKKIMCRQLKEETARRREWDAESVPVFKQWVNSHK